jgi:hypothetical protein
MKLYHATDLDSAKNMLKMGIGLDLEDYRNLLNKIAQKYKIPIFLVEKALVAWTRNEDITRGEYQGGVSFFPNIKDAKLIALIYASGAGEWKGNLLNIFIKKYARYLKVSFNSLEMQSIYKQVLGRDIPVIVEVNLPVNLISNKENIRGDCELYTNSKVPSKYIIKIHKILEQKT